jgi:hypothetical protein
MLIGSNDTLSYLRPSSWWSKILGFGKTQELPYDIQYQFYGVRLFDFRLQVDKCGHINHIGELYEMLDFFDKREDVWVRVTLDAPKIDATAERRFKDICQIIETIYKNINLYGGYRQCDRTVLYKFDWEKKNQLIQVVSPPEWSRLYRFISKWFPYLIGRLNSSYIEECEKRFCFLMLNYVNRR